MHQRQCALPVNRADAKSLSLSTGKGRSANLNQHGEYLDVLGLTDGLRAKFDRDLRRAVGNAAGQRHAASHADAPSLSSHLLELRAAELTGPPPLLPSAAVRGEGGVEYGAGARAEAIAACLSDETRL